MVPARSSWYHLGMAARASGSSVAHRLPMACDAACLAALFGASLLVASSSLMVQAPELIAGAITIDLVLTSAVCHWLVAVRWGGSSAWTTVPVAAAGLSFSRVILPGDIRSAGLLPWLAIVLVEAAALVLLVLRARTVASSFRVARANGAERLDAFEAGLLALGPFTAPLARWTRLELAVWGFFIAGWFMRPRVCPRGLVFSHHRDAGWSAIAGALAMLVMVEGAVVHLALDQAGYSRSVWVAFALHVYGLVWVIGDALALRVLRTYLPEPSRGDDAVLELRVGLRARASIPIGAIVHVGTGSWEAAGPEERLVSVAGPANVRIALSRPTALRGMLGAPVATTAILLRVDEPGRFTRALAAHLPAR